jgi:putative ABC transport system permease protein
MSPRWSKVLGDVRAARGRFLMMGVALAAGVTVVAAILAAYAILTREVPRNYTSTNPASAQLQMDRVDRALISAVRSRPEIADAQASSTLPGRIEVGPNEWMPLLLFVVPDFENLRINAFRSESGAWPPPTGSMLVERSALALTRTSVGGSLAVQTSHGRGRSLLIAGIVHDAGLAPAWQEQTVYAYITPATLATLGESPEPNLLKIVVKHDAGNARAIEATARSLAGWLRDRGHRVHEVRIPPPNRHPHQGQLNAVLTMLLIFSLLALSLGAVLTATIIGGLLAQQTRQIAIMKAIGARSGQIAVPYLCLVGLMGAVCVAIGLPPGLLAGRGFFAVVAELLNLDIASGAVPGWLFATVAALGILAPLAAALVPVLIATRRTVRAAIDDHGVARGAMAFGALDRVLARVRLSEPALTLALRNTFRRRGRLFLTLSLLATAGAMFIASVNLEHAWEDYVVQAAAYRHYDLEIQLRHPVPQAEVLARVTAIPGVRNAEAWSIAPAAVDRGDGLEIVRTYPDGGHGGFSLRSAPAQTDMVDLHLLEGRWLQPQDTDAIVLNQLARTSTFPAAKPGQWISLRVEHRPVRLRVVGITRELLTPGAGYTTAAVFDDAQPQAGLTNAIRVTVSEQGTADAVARSIVAALERDRIGVRSVWNEKLLGAAQAGHIYILVFALGFIALMMALVGTLGLASALSTSVVERTHELGVMRAIGARSGDVMKCLLSEGLFTGLMSWTIAVPLSSPISAGVGRILASISNQPLSLVLSPPAAGSWLFIVVIASAAASLYPAARASRLTVRQALAFT